MLVGALPDGLEAIRRRLPKLSSRISVSIVAGGSFRGESVRNGVRALSDKCGVVLVHDAARALVTADVVRRVERAALSAGAGARAGRLAAGRYAEGLRSGPPHPEDRSAGRPLAGPDPAGIPPGRRRARLPALSTSRRHRRCFACRKEKSGAVCGLKWLRGAPTQHGKGHDYPPDLKLCRDLLS